MKKKKLEIDPDEELRDISLCSCSLAARGLWAYIRLVMARSSRYGHLLLNGAIIKPEQLARMVGEVPEVVSTLLVELQTVGIIEEERGIFISRMMILKESIRLKRAAGGKFGGNKALKKSTKTKVSERKVIHSEENKVIHLSGEPHEQRESSLLTGNEQKLKSTSETLTSKDEVKDNHNLEKPHEQRESSHQKDDETEMPPLYILFKIDNYLKDKKEKGVWGRKLKTTIINKLGPDLREFLSKDFELLRVFLDFEEMRNKIKKPMTERAAKNIIEKSRLLSGGIIPTAINIFDQSINSNWQDIYPLKHGYTNSKTPAGVGNTGATGESSGGISRF